MLPALGHAGWWFLGANGALGAGVVYWAFVDRWGRATLAVGILAATLLAYQGYREFAGYDYRLKYRVCGMVLQDAYNQPTDLTFEIDFVNPTSRPVWLLGETTSLTFAGRASTLPAGAKEIAISPTHPQDDLVPVVTDRVQLNGILPTVQYSRGQVRYTFKYGKDRSRLDKSMIVNGSLAVNFDENGRAGNVEFTPNGDTDDYDPVACDPREGGDDGQITGTI
jgi:hypothetical protein